LILKSENLITEGKKKIFETNYRQQGNILLVWSYFGGKRHYKKHNQFILVLWCSWLRHCAANWKVAGLIPDGVNGIFH
jgi:hypothetical protein